MSYDIDHNGTYEFTRVIDRSRDALLRDSGFQLKDGTTIENQATYGYSPADGRLATISGGGLQPPNQFSYSYLASSNLIESVTKSAPVGSPVIQKLNSYESNRDVLATISNNVITANGGGFDTVTRSVYDYTTVNGGVNSLGQRGGVRSTFNLGTLTANPGDTSWGYDNLGQLQSADPPGTDADRYYQFDTIGNRLLSRTGTATNTGGTLTEYFGTVANSTPSGPGANALNQYAAIKTAPTIVQPYHDDDGNATAYPLPVSPTTNSTLVWDAENRQISATVNGVTTTYLYDALSRRIAKIPASGTAALFVYDGFNCIAEYTGTTLTKARTWGIDLSGTLQGAGGVGGLLMEKQGANSFYPTYDGNGNVSEYLTSTGAVAAHFEYDPFGNTTVNTDSNNLFVYRFSTKPLDFETGLYYYGYRYYDPLTGRWPSRDPIGENWNTGEYNEYAFIKNGPVDSIDVLGYSQLWTASGIGNYSGGEFHDYVGETLKDAGINPDHSERSDLGVGMHYLRGGWVGTPLSEEQLDGEAENKANNANYCPAKVLCKKKICVVMVAPKTHTPLPKTGCCKNIKVVTFWNPYDPVPNQGVKRQWESQEYWGQYGTAYPVNSRPGNGQNGHAFEPYLRTNPLFGMTADSNPLDAPKGYSPSGENAPNPLDVIRGFKKTCDITIVCHSQGCNIAMHLLEKGCNK